MAEQPGPYRTGPAIKDYIARQGLTARALAEQIVTSENYLSPIFNGHRVPGEELVERIATAVQANGGTRTEWAGLLRLDRRLRRVRGAQSRLETLASPFAVAPQPVQFALWGSLRRA